MSRLSNSAYCKPGDHFVPRATALAYRDGDIAALACPEHHPDREREPDDDFDPSLLGSPDQGTGEGSSFGEAT